MWDRLTNTVPSSGSILDLATVKAHCRVDYDDDDDYLTMLIGVANAYIDGPWGIGVALLTQSWAMTLDRFPTHKITIPLGPVKSIDQITYLDLNGDEQTLDPSSYVVNYAANPCVITHQYEVVWPVAFPVAASVTVAFTCGYGPTEASIPYDLRMAALLIIGNLYENREGVVGVGSRDSPMELPLGVEAILSRYRVATIS